MPYKRGTEITGQANNNPLAAFKEKIGCTLIGRIVGGPREVKMRKGVGKVWELSVDAGTCPIMQKNEAGEYEEVKIHGGDTVTIFAPTVLHRALESVKGGQLIEIIYNGMAKGKSGTDYHDFAVYEVKQEA